MTLRSPRWSMVGGFGTPLEKARGGDERIENNEAEVIIIFSTS